MCVCVWWGGGGGGGGRRKTMSKFETKDTKWLNVKYMDRVNAKWQVRLFRVFLGLKGPILHPWFSGSKGDLHWPAISKIKTKVAVYKSYLMQPNLDWNGVCTVITLFFFNYVRHTKIVQSKKYKQTKQKESNGQSFSHQPNMCKVVPYLVGPETSCMPSEGLFCCPIHEVFRV